MDYHQHSSSSCPAINHKKNAALPHKSPLTTPLETGKILPYLPTPMTPQCKHPIVKVVAREDDIEFVECQNCREVFDSAEYSDMALEEEETASKPTED